MRVFGGEPSGKENEGEGDDAKEVGDIGGLLGVVVLDEWFSNNAYNDEEQDNGKAELAGYFTAYDADAKEQRNDKDFDVDAVKRRAHAVGSFKWVCTKSAFCFTKIS